MCEFDFPPQISPQRVRVRVRVNKRARVRFRVAQAKQYPVDLYYLMDLSNSMSDDKDNIVSVKMIVIFRRQNDVSQRFKFKYSNIMYISRQDICESCRLQY